jgi:hypothetical protein
MFPKGCPITTGVIDPKNGNKGTLILSEALWFGDFPGPIVGQSAGGKDRDESEARHDEEADLKGKQARFCIDP